jgi:hypothetical protein
MVELARNEAVAVVVCEPAPLRRTRELLSAMKQYYPKVPCWQFGVGNGCGEGRLSKLDAAATSPAAKGNGQGTGGNGSEPPEPPEPPESPEPLSRLLTAEELEMLLGPAGDEATL